MVRTGGVHGSRIRMVLDHKRRDPCFRDDFCRRDRFRTYDPYRVKTSSGVSARYGAIRFARLLLPGVTGASTPLRPSGLHGGPHARCSDLRPGRRYLQAAPSEPLTEGGISIEPRLRPGYLRDASGKRRGKGKGKEREGA